MLLEDGDRSPVCLLSVNGASISLLFDAFTGFSFALFCYVGWEPVTALFLSGGASYPLFLPWI